MQNPLTRPRILSLAIVIGAALLSGADPDAGDSRVSVSAASGGTCSAILADGRSLVSGGRDSQGPLVTAGYFDRDGEITPTAPMLEARNGHVCTALQDGTVVVAGGTGKSGPTNSAEIFHPDTNTWTPTAGMLAARTGAVAIRLKNGTALVTGGEAMRRPVNTLETYDPGNGRFEQVRGGLSAPRARHAIAILEDGRVVIAGGFDGEHALYSIDLYDPVEGVVTFAGQMSIPRANFTATALPGGKVLFAGGSDGRGELASTEVFDVPTRTVTATAPMSIPRQGHIAVRIAATGQVLIAGRTADGSGIGPAESFDLSSGVFRPVAEAAEGEEAGVTFTVGVLSPEGKVGARKTYRIVSGDVEDVPADGVPR